ncbi:hypothetical protein ACH4TX_45565 [Streptomyces sp. NPDC021098]
MTPDSCRPSPTGNACSRADAATSSATGAQLRTATHRDARHATAEVTFA